MALRPLNAYGWSKALFDIFAVRQAAARRCAAAMGGPEVLQRLRPQRSPQGRDEVGRRPDLAEGRPRARRCSLFKSHRAGLCRRRPAARLRLCARLRRRSCAGCSTRRASTASSTWAPARRGRSLDLAQAVFTAAGRAPQSPMSTRPIEIRDKYQYFTQADMTRLSGGGVRAAFTSSRRGSPTMSRAICPKRTPTGEPRRRRDASPGADRRPGALAGPRRHRALRLPRRHPARFDRSEAPVPDLSAAACARLCGAAAWVLPPADPTRTTPADPPADVFFVHPTTFDGAHGWNGPIGDERSQHLLQTVMIPNYAGPFARWGGCSRRVSAGQPASLMTFATTPRTRAVSPMTTCAGRSSLSGARQRRHGRSCWRASSEGGLMPRACSRKWCARPCAEAQSLAAYLIDTPAPAADLRPVRRAGSGLRPARRGGLRRRLGPGRGRGTAKSSPDRARGLVGRGAARSVP